MTSTASGTSTTAARSLAFVLPRQPSLAELVAFHARDPLAFAVATTEPRPFDVVGRRIRVEAQLARNGGRWV